MPSVPVLPWLCAVRELVLPRTCGGCGADRTWWCADCARSLARPPVVLALDDGAGTAVVAAAAYHGPVGRAVVALKERGAAALLPPLAASLAGAVAHALVTAAGPVARPGAVVLVPVPSRPGVVRARGADVVADLARGAAALLVARGFDAVVVRALAHARRVSDQAGLGASARAANLEGALRVRRLARPELRPVGLPSPPVVVVDDVMTTGATLREAVRAVRHECPDRMVLAAVVARASRDP